MNSTCVTLMLFRGNYFRGELIRKTEVEVRVEKLKNGKALERMRGHWRDGKGWM